MIITCTACKKRYLIDQQVISSEGRMVRCVACSHTWLFKPEPEAVLAPLEATSSSSPSSIKQHPWGWVVLVVVICVTLAGLYLGREPIMALWPRAHKLYKLVGLNVYPPGYGLEFNDLRAEQVWRGDTPLFVLRGVVVNTQKTALRLPKLKIHYQTSGCDTKESPCEVTEWALTLPQERLLPGEQVSFATDPRPMPPLDATGTISLR